MTNPFARIFRRFFPPPEPPHICCPEPLPTREVIEYSNALGRYGPDSPEARAIREKYAEVPGFAGLAGGLDRIKRRMGGSGIDWEPKREVK